MTEPQTEARKRTFGSPEDVRQRYEAAYAEVIALCKGPTVRSWRMTIPAEPTSDSDLVIGAALDDIPPLLARIAELEAGLREAAMAFHLFNGRCATDLSSCTQALCVGFRSLLTPTQENPR